MAATKTTPTLVELEERIAAGGPVTPAELAEAEAASRLAAKVDDARLTREATAAEAARLAAVDATTARFAAEVSAAAVSVLAADEAIRDALVRLWAAQEEHNRVVRSTAAEVRRLGRGGATPGIEAGRDGYGQVVVTVGGTPHPKRIVGGVSAVVSPNLARTLAAEAVEDAERTRARGGPAGFALDGSKAWPSTLDSPARRRVERLTHLAATPADPAVGV